MSHPDHLLFPSHPASENLYYPVFFWTLYLVTASAQKVKDQTLINILTGIFIGLCYLTRYQTFPLIPAFFLVWWFKPDAHNTGKGEWLTNTQKLIQLFVVISSFAIIFSFWILPGLTQGVSFRDLLGFSVEGKDSLLKFDRSFSSFFFWSAATFGYVLLILSPMIPIFLSTLKRIKDASRELELRHWLMAIAIIGSVFYITVVRHAWLAGYNQEEPTRLVTRYLIYMAAPAWLTGIALVRFLKRKDMTFFIISAIISTGLVIISYELFFNRDWILPGNIMYINGNIPLYAGKVFYATVVGGSILTAFLIWKGKIHLVPTVLLLCLMYINLASLPQFRSFIMSYMVGGRFISEYIDQGILIEEKHPNSEENSSLRTVETITHLDKQLTVRGLDPSQFIFESRADLSDYPDETRMVLDIRPGEKYLILEANIADMKYQRISEFTFDGTTYEVVRSD
jgi:hypothetical protein